MLEALPAASVDTGILDVNGNDGPGGVLSSLPPDRRTSLSTTSLDSRCSDLDSYFYI